MEVEINMINVEDGDAIIVTLKNEEKKALIVIDGGYKKYYKKLKNRLNELLPDFNNEIALVVCTHYDNDHLGGISKLLDEYNEVIQEIWIHRAQGELEQDIDLLKNELKLINNKSNQTKRLQRLAGLNELSEALIIEGYNDLIETLTKIKELGLDGKVKEATRGMTLSEFSEFKVISPKIEYYNKYLPQLSKEILYESKSHLIPEKISGLKRLKKHSEFRFPCEHLEKSSLSNGVTPTNMVSIVILLEANNKKYLFTGDSGIETFEDQNLLDDEELKELHWLDLPHHGSKNNTSKSMLDHFQPKVVFVSGDGGPNRPHHLLKSCLENRKASIHVTNENNDTWYLKHTSKKDFDRIPD